MLKETELRLEALKAASKVPVQNINSLIIHTEWLYKYLCTGKRPEESEKVEKD